MRKKKRREKGGGRQDVRKSKRERGEKTEDCCKIPHNELNILSF